MEAGEGVKVHGVQLIAVHRGGNATARTALLPHALSSDSDEAARGGTLSLYLSLSLTRSLARARSRSCCLLLSFFSLSLIHIY